MYDEANSYIFHKVVSFLIKFRRNHTLLHMGNELAGKTTYFQIYVVVFSG